jgi:hypothetical protein
MSQDTGRLVLDGGKMVIKGLIDTMEDELRYQILFYHCGIKRLSYRYLLVRENEAMPYAEKLQFIELCDAVDEVVDISARKTMAELISFYGDEFDWYLDNVEYLQHLKKECEIVIENNEGWNHYGSERVI